MNLLSSYWKKTNEITIGNGLDEGVFLGPVIRDQHKENTLKYIETGVKEGARSYVMVGTMTAVKGKGYFVGPTIFDEVTSEMKIWQDEIFAPVLSISRVKNLEEAVEAIK